MLCPCQKLRALKFRLPQHGSQVLTIQIYVLLSAVAVNADPLCHALCLRHASHWRGAKKGNCTAPSERCAKMSAASRCSGRSTQAMMLHNGVDPTQTEGMSKGTHRSEGWVSRELETATRGETPPGMTPLESFRREIARRSEPKRM